MVSDLEMRTLISTGQTLRPLLEYVAKIKVSLSTTASFCCTYMFFISSFFLNFFKWSEPILLSYSPLCSMAWCSPLLMIGNSSPLLHTCNCTLWRNFIHSIVEPKDYGCDTIDEFVIVVWMSYITRYYYTWPILWSSLGKIPMAWSITTS